MKKKKRRNRTKATPYDLGLHKKLVAIWEKNMLTMEDSVFGGNQSVWSAPPKK